MAKANYILSKKAQDDLVDIWDYTVETWSVKQVEIYFQNLFSAFENIANHPTSAGRLYEDVKAGYRGVQCGRHIVFYRILKNKKVRIIRVLHERMDFERHL